MDRLGEGEALLDLGVRCAVYPEKPPEASFGPIPRVFHDYSKERPAGDDVFAAYRAFFDDDHTDLDAKVESSDVRPEHWRVEKVSFAAAYGSERVPAYLFLPRNAAPPFQTVVYFPPGSAQLLHSTRPSDLSSACWDHRRRTSATCSSTAGTCRASPT